MPGKPSYEELEQGIDELENEVLKQAQADRALRESEERFRLAFENANTGMSLVDTKGRILKVNAEMGKIFGYSQEELESMTINDIAHPEYLDISPGFIQQALSGEITRAEFEKRYIHKKGHIVWGQVVSSLVRDVKSVPLYFISHVKDITDRKRAEEALRESEEKYRAIVEDQTELICRFKPDCTLTFMNEAYARNWGKTTDQMMGVNFLTLIPEHAHENVQKHLSSFSPENDFQVKEHEVFSRTGEVRWQQWFNRAFFDDEGNIFEFQSVGRDITDRKRAEEALRESEERFKETVELLPSIVCEFDTNGRFTYVNTYGLETFSYTHTDLEQGFFAADLFPPSELERFKDRFGLLLQGETPAPTEYRLQTKDGSTICVIADSAPIYKDEKIVGVRFNFTPITERKQVEKALKISEQKYRELSDLLPQTVFETDKDGNVTFANRIAFDLFGYTRDDLKRGVNALQMLIPEDRDRAKENIERIFRGEELGGNEYTALRKDGSTYPVLIYSSPIIREGEPVGLRGIMADLSEIKKAEESLKESEKKYRTVLEANPDPVVVYDIEGKVIYFNPAFTRVFGWSLEERLGKKMDLFVPEDAWQETKMMIEKVVAGERFSGIETRRYNQKGEIIPVSISGAIYKDRDGQPLGSVINLRDISEQKRLETQFQAAQKIEAIGTLAGGIAHDFNNLLMGIQGRTSLMLNDINSSHPHIEHLKGIEDYVKSAADLTKQLLGFARGGKYEVKPTDLNVLIKRENKMFGRTRKEINIQEKFEKDLWATEVDQGQIEQVLLNLYVNSWQAMPGGGDLYIQTENIVIDESFNRPYHVGAGKYVKISVTDTGVGMDEATQQRIFDPFFTTKDMGRGTGLGLASVYGIIKHHNGFIDVYSKRGEGTTFNIYLPASEKEAVKEKEVNEEFYRGTGTLLLVDDEDMIVDVGCGIIEKLGYKVLAAKSGKEAIEIYEKNQGQIDLVILDMIMPDMGGGETYDKLKEINPGIKVLLSSGYSIDGEATKILERGCNGFIQKPFNMADLSKKIREILEKD